MQKNLFCLESEKQSSVKTPPCQLMSTPAVLPWLQERVSYVQNGNEKSKNIEHVPSIRPLTGSMFYFCVLICDGRHHSSACCSLDPLWTKTHWLCSRLEEGSFTCLLSVLLWVQLTVPLCVKAARGLVLQTSGHVFAFKLASSVFPGCFLVLH